VQKVTFSDDCPNRDWSNGSLAMYKNHVVAVNVPELGSRRALGES
jgi:hypothetical protein